MNWMLMPLRRYADFSGRSRRANTGCSSCSTADQPRGVDAARVTFIAGMSEPDDRYHDAGFILYALIVLAS